MWAFRASAFCCETTLIHSHVIRRLSLLCSSSFQAACNLLQSGLFKLPEFNKLYRWWIWIPSGIACNCCIWIMHWLSLSPRRGPQQPQGGCRLHSILSNGHTAATILCLSREVPRPGLRPLKGCIPWFKAGDGFPVAEGDDSGCEPGCPTYAAQPQSLVSSL